MTSETLILVPLRLTEEHGRLLGDIRSAAARALKADAGDRSDVARFEALCVQLEKAAERHATETGEFHELDAETTTRVASHVGPAVAVGQDAPAYGESLLSALRGLCRIPSRSLATGRPGGCCGERPTTHGSGCK